MPLACSLYLNTKKYSQGQVLLNETAELSQNSLHLCHLVQPALLLRGII